MIGVKGSRGVHALASLTVVAALLVLAPAALAKTYKPNTRSDHSQNGCTHSDCTLREAITSANFHLGYDKIELQEGKTYRLSLVNPAGGENLNASGDLDITDAVQIRSDGDKRAKVNAQHIDRVFDVFKSTGGVNAKFNRVEIQGGTLGAAASGAGIRADTLGGQTTLLKSKVTGNGATGGDGGGFFVTSSASALIDRSTISGNSAVVLGGAVGGGVAANTTGAVTVTSSTISGNVARHGGGLDNAGAGPVSVTNSTIAENTALNNGGGIRRAGAGSGPVTLFNATVARNVADADHSGTGMGGGLFRSGGTAAFTVQNSIVGLNRISSGLSDCNGTFVSLGVNLLTSLFGGCSGFAFPPNLLTSDPKLGSLKNRGGFTKTIGLNKHSPAINNAGGGTPKRDQRGEKRHNPDIGAYERT
jgi:parallel beta helix pectate lyase-like protein